MRETYEDILKDIELLKKAMEENNLDDISAYASYLKIDAEGLRSMAERRLERAEW